MKILKYIGISLITSILVVAGANFLFDKGIGLGAITTILGTDRLTDSRTTLNDNFTDLDTTKMEMSTTSVDSITTLLGLTSATGITAIGNIITGTWSALFKAGLIDGEDMNLTSLAGDYLTAASSTKDLINVDVEIYTYGISANMFATSTADGISTTTESFISLQIPFASTITNFSCYAQEIGTSTVRVAVSTDGLSAGTDILYTSGVECGAEEEVATSTFSSTAIGANDWLHFYIFDAEPTGSRPQVIYGSFTATKND